jgi:hypothetical protein
VFGSEAWLSRQMNVELTRLPPASVPVFFLLGATRVSIDLTPAGMTGCTLHCNPDIALPASGFGGRAAFNTTLPSTASLLGARFLSQGFVLDAPANPLGITASNGVEATVGSLL